MFAKREHALPTKQVHCIVYTSDAYCKDPEVTEEEAKAASKCNFVLVAVLATPHVGLEPEVSLGRFVSNLAGGNRRYDMPDTDGGLEIVYDRYRNRLEDIKLEAKRVLEYNAKYITVADEF
jgi:hypothetical protein